MRKSLKKMIRILVRRQAQFSKQILQVSSYQTSPIISAYQQTNTWKTFSSLSKTNFLETSKTVRLLSTQVNDFPNSEKKNSNESEHKASENKKLSTRERLKVITTQYGAFGMAFHITISLASLGMFYFLVYSGVDFAPFMAYIGMQDSKIATGASTFVIAYAVHKVFAPVRIGITFVSVPVLVRHFRKIGFFKK